MKIGIICAGDVEIEPFIPLITDCVISEKAMLKIHEGKINGVNVVALFSGVCKVNAAIATQILIDTYKADIVINSGTAGGMNPELEVFDTVIATEVTYHDVSPNILTKFHPWMKTAYFHSDAELLKLSKIVVDKLKLNHRVRWGRMVTGEAFIVDEGRQKINDEFSPLTVDMETASIAHVCYVNSIPFISIRTITDTATHNNNDVELNCSTASDISKNITIALLKEIKNSWERDKNENT